MPILTKVWNPLSRIYLPVLDQIPVGFIPTDLSVPGILSISSRDGGKEGSHGDSMAQVTCVPLKATFPPSPPPRLLILGPSSPAYLERRVRVTGSAGRDTKVGRTNLTCFTMPHWLEVPSLS